MQDSTVKFEVREVAKGCLVINCHGGLSWEDRDLLTEGVRKNLDPHGPISGVVLDLAQIEFINSAGVGALFQLLNFLRCRGGRLAFVNVSPPIMRLFRTVGLNRSAAIGESLDDALESLVAAANPPDADN